MNLVVRKRTSAVCETQKRVQDSEVGKAGLELLGVAVMLGLRYWPRGDREGVLLLLGLFLVSLCPFILFDHLMS